MNKNIDKQITQTSPSFTLAITFELLINYLLKISMGDTTAGDCGLNAPRIAEEEYSTAQGGV